MGAGDRAARVLAVAARDAGDLASGGRIEHGVALAGGAVLPRSVDQELVAQQRSVGEGQGDGGRHERESPGGLDSDVRLCQGSHIVQLTAIRAVR